MQFVVVYNPSSGSSVSPKRIKTLFKRARLSVTSLLPITVNLESALAPYLDNSNVVVAAIGGDGTLSSVANIIMNKKVKFAPLPGGTLNHFTKDLGIPQDIELAIANLASPKLHRIDTASINGLVFLNNSSLGLYPSSLQMRDEMERKNISKWPAAIIASFKALMRYRSHYITINGESFKTPFVFIGNNDYRLEERMIGERKKMNEGILSVYAIEAADRLSLLKVFLYAVIGRMHAANEVRIWKTKHLTIDAAVQSLRISRDGEHKKLSTPLTYEVHPRSLTIVR